MYDHDNPPTPALVAGAVGRLRIHCDTCPGRAILGLSSVACGGCGERNHALLCRDCYTWAFCRVPVEPVPGCDTCGAVLAPTMIGSVDFIINL